MHNDDLTPWQQNHAFDSGNPLGEKSAWRVVALTAAMMVVEIAAGWATNSMALLADGWHMGTHVAAIGITAAGYGLARRHANDARYAFGTWKIEILAGFASAIVLVMVAIAMISESVQRFFAPREIQYDQALVVACVGLAVNLASALILAGRGGHDHGHDAGAGHAQSHDHAQPGGHARAHGHAHAHHHADLNLRAATTHVIADAATSVLAIAALAGAKIFGWNWLDPAIGIVGAVLVSAWAVGLVRDTSRVLLDREMDCGLVGEIRRTLEADGETRVSDLHVWRVGRGHYASIVSVVTARPRSPHHYKSLLRQHSEIAHLTVEVSNALDGAPPAN